MLYLRSAFRNSSIKGLCMSFYAVARGHNVGIYDSWTKCEEQVKGFKGAKYKKFKSSREAEAFLQKMTGLAMTEKPVSTPKDFWPEEERDSVGDLELLAAAAAVELPSCSDIPVRNKRKGNADGEIKPKQKKYPVHVSNVWKPVGFKTINNLPFEIDSEDYVIVYTDGSCINNGRPDACAGLGVYFGENHSLNESRPVTGRVTNNVGEIQAAIHAIKTAKAFGIEKLCVSTDSQFLINSITIWIKVWKQNDWCLKNGKPLKNTIDFKELYELLAGESIQVKWNYVKGHHCIIGNQMADKLAREGSDMYRRLNNLKRTK
ncbi:ribonuclease H1 isoform X1 [Anastrepha obliqua]|uniref:ribonuclease H1 isoform X1 n=1 Tax=Anastrepha obliqua TaxID=95512 RepID=UPI00240A6223|nr:ribonuclease H1 isoform X1 [Anastrepha obliqua]